MATAPKTIVKTVAKSAPAAAEGGGSSGKKSPKKLIIMIVIGVLVLAIAGAAAMFFMTKKKADKDAAKESTSAHDAGKPPVFLPLEPFTVNLMSENGDQFLQATFTLQVADTHQSDLLKLYTPQIRSRLLILLSGKKASEIASTEGKTKLTEEIIELIRKPFAANGNPQDVDGVFITSFVIQ